MRAAHQAEAVAALSIGQLASAAAFFQAEGDFTEHEFDVIAEPLLDEGALSGTAFIQRVPRLRAGRLRTPPRRADLRTGATTGPGARRSAAGLLPDRLRGQRPRRRRPGRLRPRRRPRPRALPAPRPRPRQAGGDAAGEAAARRRRHQRLPAGLPRRRPDRNRGRAPRGADRLRRRRLPRQRPRRGGDLDRRPTQSTCSCGSTATTVVGHQGELDDAASAPIHIADRTWLLVVRDPNRPDVSLPLLLAVIGIALAALLGALILVWSRNERMQELQREAEPGPADRAEEPAPLRGGPARWRWPAAAARAPPGRC